MDAKGMRMPSDPFRGQFLLLVWDHWAAKGTGGVCDAFHGHWLRPARCCARTERSGLARASCGGLRVRPSSLAGRGHGPAAGLKKSFAAQNYSSLRGYPRPETARDLHISRRSGREITHGMGGMMRGVCGNREKELPLSNK